MSRNSVLNLFAALLSILQYPALLHGDVWEAPNGAPDATVNLATAEGTKIVQGQWRYSDTRIIEVDFTAPGADGQPTTQPIRTYDYTPHAGGSDFDDSG